MTRVLLTGFAPFEGESLNPSWQAVRAAAAEPPAGIEASAIELPCVYGASIAVLRAAIEEARPEIVVCVGQAGGRPDITVERLAVNVDDARIPDASGAEPIDEAIVPGGPAAYFSTLPIKACVAAVRAAGLPASVSNTAGTFVCNHVFYGLAHLIATELPGVRGGFVHVPYAPEQVVDRSQPSLPSEAVTRALHEIALTTARTHTDIRVAGGATH
ncbi:pyroglutamyl-peptidase I [Streptomyces platensis]|uniref:Pyrrolidone-carboxylate peptidase n=1 Tax=Streptomyces platensis TaxID=58346 RepID=A0AAE6TKV8_STRPT|nr:pyroglutamyl-peptidase I [Streptomyces platensis]OSY46355.1 Pyrrolidone-carboxylate peptidase [Streptomyces platensis]QEV51124.1 pyroglutamyl-peptidase I [Streptomyces platensis]BCK72847.1 pyrrolidone-carboxylate peptidase [Streptomyces libani subsp. rufus]